MIEKKSHKKHKTLFSQPATICQGSFIFIYLFIHLFIYLFIYLLLLAF